MKRLWLDILVSFALFLFIWTLWELAVIFHMTSSLIAIFWKLGYYPAAMADTMPTTFNIMGLALLIMALFALFLLFNGVRNLFDKLLLRIKN